MANNSGSNGLGKGWVIGLLTGGAIGAALGLLLAPKSGKELRQDISDVADQYKEKAGTVIQDAGQRAQEIADKGMQRTKSLIADAKQKASSLLSEAENILNERRSRKSSAATVGYEDPTDHIAD